MPIKQTRYKGRGSGAVPVKIWTVDIEETAQKQLEQLAEMPFMFRHVAAMPDVHAGKGSTIGSVIATKGAVIPSAVGVDIGCGMSAVRLNLKVWELADHDQYRLVIEDSIPHGRSDNGGIADIGAWSLGKIPEDVMSSYEMLVDDHRYTAIKRHIPTIDRDYRVGRQLGTLGGGNHFIELCADSNDDVWVVVHSGSRGAGASIGNFFMKKAKELCKAWFINLPDPDLAFFPKGEDWYTQYLMAMSWAQKYAAENRRLILNRVIDCVTTIFGEAREIKDGLSCHHNYATVEKHFGNEVIITRKGAISARENEKGIIPGSMGARSYIVRGLGERESFMSAPHGAGRKMSRAAARKNLDFDEQAIMMGGVSSNFNENLIDEAPGAYKDIDVVMENASDLVQVTHTLKQFVNVKGDD